MSEHLLALPWKEELPKPSTEVGIMLYYFGDFCLLQLPVALLVGNFSSSNGTAYFGVLRGGFRYYVCGQLCEILSEHLGII